MAKESVSVLIKATHNDEVSVGVVVSTDEVSVGRAGRVFEVSEGEVCIAASDGDSRVELRVQSFDACLRGTVKLRRAHGGCLGDQRRRRTWIAAKSSG